MRHLPPPIPESSAVNAQDSQVYIDKESIIQSKCLETSVKQTSKRIAFVDALRGFTMILVVWHHVADYSFGLSIEDSLLMEIFISFRMPMFFFISGFIAYKAVSYWNYKNTLKLYAKKSRVQIIPCLIFWLMGMLVIGKISLVNIPTIFLSSFPGFWWFTIGLFMMFSIYYFSGIISHYSSPKLFFPIMIGVAIILALFKDYFQSELGHILTLEYVARFFPFFIYGLVLRKHQNRFYSFLDNSYSMATCILVVVALTYISYGSGLNLSHNIKAIVRTIIGFPFIIVVFCLFYKSSDYYNKNGRIAKIMLFIGKRTLDIYLLHFFFIPNLMWMQPYIIGVKQTVQQGLVITTVSLTIVILTLTVSKVLRLSPFLAKYLFGANN